MARSRDSNRQRKEQERRLSSLASQHAEGELSAGDFAAALVDAHPWVGLDTAAVATMSDMRRGVQVVGLALNRSSLVDVHRSGVLAEDPRIVTGPPYKSFELGLWFANRQSEERTRPDGFVVGERAIGDFVTSAANEWRKDKTGRLGSKYLELAAALAMLGTSSEDATSLKAAAIEELVAGTKYGELRSEGNGRARLADYTSLHSALELLHLLAPEEAEHLVMRLQAQREDDPDCTASIEGYLKVRAELYGA